VIHGCWSVRLNDPVISNVTNDCNCLSNLLLNPHFYKTMEFEWDPKKAALNLKKHKVSFAEAATVFSDFCQRANIMKKTTNKNIETELDDELRPEYDLSQLKGGVRGKCAERYRAGSNVVVLAPDVAEAFPNEEAVNEALRLLIKIATTQLKNGQSLKSAS
jgi:hypothetical protein